MIKKVKTGLCMILLTVGLVFSILIYYYTSPFTHMLIRPLFNVFPLLKALLIMSAAYSLGFHICKKLKINLPNNIRHFLILLMGEQILIYLLLIMGALKLLNHFYFVPLILLLNLSISRKMWKYFQWQLLFIRSFKTNSIYTQSLCFLLITISVILIANSFTPISWYDSSIYHMAIPFEYLLNGQVIHIPGNVYASFPLNAEFLNLACLLFGGETSTKFMIVIHIFLILCILGKFITEQKCDYNLKLVSFLIIASNTIIFKQIIHGNIDVFLTFALTTCYLFIFHVDFKRRSDYILSGLFSAILMGYKYLAGPFFVLPIFLYIFIQSRIKRLPLSGIFYYLCSVFMFLSPWLIKNYVLVNNPFYPFLYSVFKNSREWNPFLDQVFLTSHMSESVDFQIVVKSFFKELDGLIILLSLFSFTRKKDRLFLTMIFISFPLWIFLSKGSTRFILPIYPILVSIGFINLSQLKIDINHKIIKLMFVIFIIFRMNALFLMNSEIPIYAYGIKEPKERLKDFSDPYYASVKYLNETLPKNANVLFLTEGRTYDCRFKLSKATVFNKNPIEDVISKSETVTDVVTQLKKMGFTHVFYNHSEFLRLNNNYSIRFPVIPGYSFQKDSKDLRLFLKFIRHVQQKNIMPKKISHLVALYKL